MDMMRKGILMYGEEPTDEELAELMHLVALEAKERDDEAMKKFNEKMQEDYIELVKKYKMEKP